MRSTLNLITVVLGMFVTGSSVIAGQDAAFNAKGVKIHYIVEGHGPPVVLIHGLYSSIEMNWKLPGVLDALARNHTVIAFDLPGHGESDKPDDASAYGLQMADDVALLMDHLHVHTAQVVGYSLGGLVEMKFIATHPDRVTAALVGGMGYMREGSGLQKIWEHMGGRDGGRTPAVCVQSVSQLAMTEDEVKSIRVPVEIVIGDRDPVKKMYVAPLEQVRGDWPIVTIEGAGHINCIMKPQFKEAVVAWVDGHDPK